MDATFDLNQASVEALMQRFPNLGLLSAEDVVAYREQNGPITSVQPLVEELGIPEDIANEMVANVAKNATCIPSDDEFMLIGASAAPPKPAAKVAPPEDDGFMLIGFSKPPPGLDLTKPAAKAEPAKAAPPEDDGFMLIGFSKPPPGLEAVAPPAIEPEPALAIEPEPAPAIEPEPALAIEPEPAPAIEPEPAPAIEPEPPPPAVVDTTSVKAKLAARLAVKSEPVVVASEPPPSRREGASSSRLASLTPFASALGTLDRAASEPVFLAVLPADSPVEQIRQASVRPPRTSAAPAEAAAPEADAAPAAATAKSVPPVARKRSFVPYLLGAAFVLNAGVAGFLLQVRAESHRVQAPIKTMTTEIHEVKEEQTKTRAEVDEMKARLEKHEKELAANARRVAEAESRQREAERASEERTSREAKEVASLNTRLNKMEHRVDKDTYQLNEALKILDIVEGKPHAPAKAAPTSVPSTAPSHIAPPPRAPSLHDTHASKASAISDRR